MSSKKSSEAVVKDIRRKTRKNVIPLNFKLLKKGAF